MSHNPFILKKFNGKLIFGKMLTYKEHNMWLLRNYVSKDEQIKLFFNLELYTSTNGKLITGFNNIRPYQQLSTSIWDNMRDEKISNFPTKSYFPSLTIIRLYQNYEKETVRKFLFSNYGIYVFLGTRCKFTYGKYYEHIRSGDVLIFDTSEIPHGVTNIQKYNLPWFSPYFGSLCVIKLLDFVNMPVITEKDFENDDENNIIDL